MVEKTTVWVDSQGKFHRTEVEAKAAEVLYNETKEVDDIATILQTVSRRMGERGLPQTLQKAAEVAIKAYPDMKKYYGD